MENILAENIECSINPDCYQHGIKSMNNQFNCDLDKLVKEGKVIKLKSSADLKYFSWQLIGINKFDKMKAELNEFYKIVDPNILRLNPDKANEIRYYTEQKKHEIAISLDKFLNKEKNPKSFVENKNELESLNFWFHITKRILEQPIFIIDAIEMYPESIEENQRIYLRHKEIKGNIEVSGDKHIERSIEYDIYQLLNLKLAREVNLKSLFYFFQDFINILKYPYPGVDYLKTPLFKLLFSEFLPFYERGIKELNLLPFEMIETTKEYLNEHEEQFSIDNSDESEPRYKTIYTTVQLGEIFKRLVEKRITKNQDKENFLSIFQGNNTGMVFWDDSKRGAKASLFCLMEKITGQKLKTTELKNLFNTNVDDNNRPDKPTKLIDDILKKIK